MQAKVSINGEKNANEKDSMKVNWKKKIIFRQGKTKSVSIHDPLILLHFILGKYNRRVVFCKSSGETRIWVWVIKRMANFGLGTENRLAPVTSSESIVCLKVVRRPGLY